MRPTLAALLAMLVPWLAACAPQPLGPAAAVEVEAYRPFFILGEATTPGQFPYVPDMTVETAVAVAGGFTPRARRTRVELHRQIDGQPMQGVVPVGYPVRPGDTIVVAERWF